MSKRFDALSAWRVRLDIFVANYGIWPALGALAIVVASLAISAVAGDWRGKAEADRATLAKRLERAKPAEKRSDSIAESAIPPAWDVLPASKQHSDDLKKLFALARQRGLRVDRADYLRAAETVSAIESFELTLPLSGSYPAVRRFTEDALRALPHLSVDQLSFERDAVASTSLSARIKLTLWYRASAANTRPGASAS